MKLAIRALVLGIAVSGLAASALSAHMGNNPAMTNSQATALASHQVAAAAMPIPVCIPSCSISSGLHR